MPKMSMSNLTHHIMSCEKKEMPYLASRPTQGPARMRAAPSLMVGGLVVAAWARAVPEDLPQGRMTPNELPSTTQVHPAPSKLRHSGEVRRRTALWAEMAERVPPGAPHGVALLLMGNLSTHTPLPTDFSWANFKGVDYLNAQRNQHIPSELAICSLPIPVSTSDRPGRTHAHWPPVQIVGRILRLLLGVCRHQYAGRSVECGAEAARPRQCLQAHTVVGPKRDELRQRHHLVRHMLRGR